MNGLTKRLDGWYRLGLLLTLLWLAISLSVYFSWLNASFAPNFPAPGWMTTWIAINPLEFPLYEGERVAGSGCMSIDIRSPGGHSRYDVCELRYGFNLLGFLLFVLGPVAVLWAAIFACRLVSREFRK
jgi:hypothetical protein